MTVMKGAFAVANDRLSLLAYLLLAAVSIWWAGSYILIKIAVLDVPPATLATARLLIAATVLLVWLRFGHAESLPASFDAWARYAQIALFGHALPLYLIAWASMTVPVSEMAILVATTPLFAVLLACLALREKPSRATIFGLLLGFISLAGFLSPSAVSTLYSSRSAAPLAALLGAAASYALSGRAVARLQDKNALVTGTAVMICAIPMLLPLSLAFERPWAITPTAQALVALLLLGVVSTAVMYVVYYRLIRLSGPAFASTHHYLVPALSIAFGAGFLGERPTPIQMMLVMPIIASVFIVRGLISRKL
ncbi:DMT family transporter [Mesorhizobium sp. M2E.F.Ca.ET.166.01.1.1]|nr:DMT family transporter [Mesorhizobium sp. M2E.F.Ca.ET.219.01.1.1]TGS14400.1 DMT family transporter [Mesorhizobium sp. M2E.F.Ca.ET.209.01.1.1]TGT65453.1 DMT family transporter [Mesorhizobium sp. M2E.F.Ca.ET.166.01.1.1]TGV97499.1 DMT family transporter [Mesorhizobium sp. M2E.F.Ca.ET.154.01.1.1]